MSKKDDIFEAALKLFVGQGEQATSMKLIAKEARCGAGTLYRNFTSKDELICELYIKLKINMFEIILEGHNATLPVKKQFTKAWIQAIGYALSHPAEYKYLDMFAHTPKISDEAEARVLKALYPILELYEQGKREGIIKDVDTITLLSFTTGAITGSMLNKFDISKNEIETIIAMAWDAIKS